MLIELKTQKSIDMRMQLRYLHTVASFELVNYI